MKTLTISINETDYLKFGFQKEQIPFEELLKKVSLYLAKQSLNRTHEIAEKTGLSKMTLEEINSEIKAVRNAKNYT